MAKKKHAPYCKLKGLLREKGETYESIAQLLELSVPSVTRKINGESDFYLTEAEALCTNLGTDLSLFLP